MAKIPRLSALEMRVLQLLVRKDEMYGLQLVQESDGMLKRGTVYVTLDRMERKGYIDSRKESPPEGATGHERRLYRPSGYGIRVLEAWEMMLQGKLTLVIAT